MMRKKVPFGVTWTLIACASIFTFYTAQLLNIVSNNTEALNALTETLNTK